MSSPVITYVGRTTNFKGKTLWEIVGSLKNYGVGRLVVRSVFERYPEPCFMKIVKVETCPDEAGKCILSQGRDKIGAFSTILHQCRLQNISEIANGDFIIKYFFIENLERRRVRVWVEKTFRGRKLPKLTEIYRTSYKPDYKLIPKDEESKLIELAEKVQVKEVILPNTVEMPPLMKRFIVKDHEKKGLEIIKDFVLPISYNHSPNRVTRIAKGDDKPTLEFTMGLGKPVSPSLYEDVSIQQPS